MLIASGVDRSVIQKFKHKGHDVVACARLVVREGAAATYDDMINTGEIRTSTGGAGVASEVGASRSDRSGAAQARARRVTEFTWEGCI